MFRHRQFICIMVSILMFCTIIKPTPAFGQYRENSVELFSNTDFSVVESQQAPEQTDFPQQSDEMNTSNDDAEDNENDDHEEVDLDYDQEPDTEENPYYDLETGPESDTEIDLDNIEDTVPEIIFEFNPQPVRPVTEQEALENDYRWQFPIDSNFIPDGFEQIRFEDKASGTFYWTLTMVERNLRGVSNFEDLKTQMQKAAQKGGVTYIDISESFDFLETIVLETSSPNVNIIFRCQGDIVLGVEGPFRHFEIITPGHFILELKGAVLDGKNLGGGIYYTNPDYQGLDPERPSYNSPGLSLFSGSIVNCVADEGGGLFIDEGYAVVEAMLIKDNTVRKNGGGIYIKNGMLLLMADTVISYNSGTTATYGGGVYAGDGCYLEIRLSVIEHNEAHLGGGVALGDKAVLQLNGYIRRNRANQTGGGIYGLYNTQSQTEEILETSYIRINGYVGYNEAEVSAGGIYGGEVTIGQSGSVDNNTVVGPGFSAGILCAFFVMNDGSVSNNTLITPSDVYAWPSIGILCRNAVINGGIISGNTYTNETGKLTAGGGIFCVPRLDGDTVTMNGGTITENKAHFGGGIFMHNESGGLYTTQPTIYINDGEISGNEATYGGGICSYGYDIEVIGGEISDNLYGLYGGGIYSSGEKLTISDAVITGNKPAQESGKQYGGGIYLNVHEINSEILVNISGDTIIENNESTNGGGLYLGVSRALSPGSLRMTGNVSISGNTAANNGGGLYTSNMTGVLEGPLKIQENTASKGGGIAASRSVLDIGGNSETFLLTGNTADNGGGLYATNEGTEVRFLSSVIIASNTAEEDGGGIWVDELEKISVLAPTVVFEQNLASEGFYVTDEDHIALHEGQIHTETFTPPFRYAYNNYDIVYTDGELHEEDQYFTVTFESNGGTDVPLQKVKKGGLVQAPEDVENTGYVLGAWKKDSVIIGKFWDFETDTVSEDMTLYALWLFDKVPVPSPDNIVVRYHSNGGSGSYTHLSGQNDYTILSLSETGISRAQYTFTGWNTQSNGDGTEYKPGQQIELNGNLELYAQWESNNTGGGGGNGGGGSGGGGNGDSNNNGGGDIKDADNEEDEQTTPIEPPTFTEEHKGYVAGYPDGSFRPDGYITRAETAMIFYNLIEAPDKETMYTASFHDTENGSWYYQAVAYMEKHNIMIGYPDGSFQPGGNITRGELAAACSNFFRDIEEAGYSFSDVDENHWAYSFVANAYVKGWIAGYPDGLFKPDQYITRAETVTMMNKILNRRLMTEDIPHGVKRYVDLEDNYWAYPDIIEASHSHDYIYKENGWEQWEYIKN